MGFYCFSSNVFYFPELSFFVVTCSCFVLNSANDSTQILALPCLRSLVWLFCVAPFGISFLFVVLGYFLTYRKGMASVRTAVNRGVHKIVPFLCGSVYRACTLRKPEDGGGSDRWAFQLPSLLGGNSAVVLSYNKKIPFLFGSNTHSS